MHDLTLKVFSDVARPPLINRNEWEWSVPCSCDS